MRAAAMNNGSGGKEEAMNSQKSENEGAGGAGDTLDQDLLDDFKELIDGIAERVVRQAVAPEITQATADLRKSAAGARGSLAKSTASLERITSGAHDEREAFKAAFMRELESAFREHTKAIGDLTEQAKVAIEKELEEQSSVLTDLAQKTRASIESAAAVTSSREFLDAASEARALTDSFRTSQTKREAAAVALIKQTEGRLTALNEQVARRQMTLEAALTQQGERLDALDRNDRAHSQGLIDVMATVASFRGHSESLLGRHEQLVGIQLGGPDLAKPTLG